MSCSNLRIIDRKNETYFDARCCGLLPSSELYKRASRLVRYVHPLTLHSRTLAIVPCGKCMDCLKRRQSDLAVRCEREAVKRGSMHFVTLTYRQEDLPFAYRYYLLDYESGEILEQSPYRLCVRSGEDTDISSDFHGFLIEKFKSLVAGKEPIYIPYTVCEHLPDSPYLGAYMSFTPSLNRRDVRLWLKNCRVSYEREFKKKLPVFSYVLTGEFGPNTCRPHYHLCFFGLTDNIIRWFVSRWPYGDMNDWKAVNARNPDNSSGFNRASRYVAKYVTKGKFECCSVLNGDCEKPRLCISKGLGLYLNFELMSYFRCYDLFGKYNPDTLVLEGSGRRRLSDSQVKQIIEVSRQRSFISVDGGTLPLPRGLIKKIWFVYDKVKKSYRATTLRAISAGFAADVFMANYERKFKDFISHSTAASLSEACSQFTTFIQSSNLLSEVDEERDFSRFYSKSLF